jgi:hypothetical protein
MNQLQKMKICVEKMKPFSIKSTPQSSDKFLKTKLLRLKAAFLKSKIWPISKNVLNVFFINPEQSVDIPRTVYNQDYVLDDNGNKVIIDPLQKIIDKNKMSIIDSIKLIINERYNKFNGIIFEFVDNINDSDIRIGFDSTQGAWSYVGLDSKNVEYKNQPTMNLGWFDVATVLHEFGHSLGLVHEHQNFKNNPVQWNNDIIYSWALQTQGWDKETTKRNIIEKYNITQLNGSVFDSKSIMLYFFPNDITLNNKGTSENLRLSATDVVYLSETYPGGKMNPQDFYQYAYNKDINYDLILQSPINNTQNSYSLFIYILIGSLVLIIIILLYLKFFNKPKSFSFKSNHK